MDSTRELPVVDAGPTAERSQPGAERPRPEWAEETPLDDLPSLTDTLLGSHDEWTRWEHGGQGQGAPYGGPQGGAERPEGRGDAQDTGDGTGDGKGDSKGDGKGKGRRWGRRG